MTAMSLPEILGAYLATQGQHEAGQRAYASTTRAEWVKLARLAVETAPAGERRNVACKLTAELNKPENGGPAPAAPLPL